MVSSAIGSLVAIAAYGAWHTRRHRSLNHYLRGDETVGWLTIGISVAATQASATGPAVHGQLAACGAAVPADGLIAQTLEQRIGHAGSADDRAVFQLHCTAGPDAAALGISAGPRSDALLPGCDLTGSAVAPLSGVVLHNRVDEGQRALVVDGAAVGRRARAGSQAVLQRHVLQGQRASAGHVEQTEGRRPRAWIALNDVATATEDG